MYQLSLNTEARENIPLSVLCICAHGNVKRYFALFKTLNVVLFDVLNRIPVILKYEKSLVPLLMRKCVCRRNLNIPWNHSITVYKRIKEKSSHQLQAIIKMSKLYKFIVCVFTDIHVFCRWSLRCHTAHAIQTFTFPSFIRKCQFWLSWWILYFKFNWWRNWIKIIFVIDV